MVYIKVDTANAQKQLVMVSVGKGNAFVAEISGIPNDVTNLQFHLQKSVNDEYMTFSAEPLANSRWRASVPGTAFQSVGDMKYHITAMDDDGRGVWFGVGKMRVMPGVANVNIPGGDPDVPVPSGDGEVYIRNRRTGLWHKVEMEMDENGTPYPVYSKEGVVR